MITTAQIADWVEAALARVRTHALDLRCLSAEIQRDVVVLVLRRTWWEAGTFRESLDQPVDFLPEALLQAPARALAFIEGWAASLPRLAAAQAHGYPEDLCYPGAAWAPGCHTAEDWVAFFAAPGLCERLGLERRSPEALLDREQVRPVARDRALEACIDADPGSDAPWQVYADWLLQQGDDRGAVILGMIEGADDEARFRASELRARRGRYLLGGLAGYTRAGPSSGPELQITWRNGYLDTARIAIRRGATGQGAIGPALVRSLAELPAARFLRGLTLGLLQDSGTRYREVLPFLQRAGPRPTMRELFLGDFSYPWEQEISWVEIGDIGHLLLRYPRLRALRLRGTRIGLGQLPTPRLESLILETGGLPRQPVEAIAAASLPALHRLELWFGCSGYGAECGEDDVIALLQADRFPRLRHLGLRNAEFTDALCAWIVTAPLLPRLQILDLSLGILTDAGARILERHGDRLAHLERLDLSGCVLSPEGVERVRGLCRDVRVQDQRPVEDELYVSVGE